MTNSSVNVGGFSEAIADDLEDLTEAVISCVDLPKRTQIRPSPLAFDDRFLLSLGFWTE